MNLDTLTLLKIVNHGDNKERTKCLIFYIFVSTNSNDLPTTTSTMSTALYFAVSMNNPANQLPSYDSDTILQSNSSYFCLPVSHTPAEIKRDQMVIIKENTGYEGPKQFTFNLMLPLKH